MANVFKQYQDSKISANLISEGFHSPTISVDDISPATDTVEASAEITKKDCGKSHFFPCSGCCKPCTPRLSDADLLR